MNTNNIIKVNIHVFNVETSKTEIIKVSVIANSIMELCERIAGKVEGRHLHYLLARPELFKETSYLFPSFTKAFKNYLSSEKEIGVCCKFEYIGISLDK